MKFFSELKRRNVLRFSMAYIVIAWLVIQVVDTLAPAFGFGSEAVRYATITLVIIMIPSVIFSWLFELTPEGLKKDTGADSAISIKPQTGRSLDRTIIIVLALGITYFTIDKFVITPQFDAIEAEKLSQRIEQEREAARVDVLQELRGSHSKSIAVLPFVNMSADPNQEYFSDGISEELLNLLAKIPELRVISRSSAFALKGKDINIVEVGERLGVAHVLEGSVRKSGNKIRITVQLIETKTDFHLWSETYDRQLDDIFTIQDEIAGIVVDQLKIELLGDEITVPIADTEAYQLFLQARHFLGKSTQESYQEALALSLRALEIDPDYVPAWDVLARIYLNQVASGLKPMQEGTELARSATEKALTLDPDHALAHANLGAIAIFDSSLSVAAHHFERALELEPKNIFILNTTALFLKSLGRLSDALALEEYIVTRDPLNPIAHNNIGFSYYSIGDWDKAIESYTTALRLSPGGLFAHYVISASLMRKGNAEQALIEAEKETLPVLALAGKMNALNALGRRDAYQATRRTLIEKWSGQFPDFVAMALAQNGEVEQALDMLETAKASLGGRINPFYLEFSSLKGHPRWEALLKELGKSPEQLDAIEFDVKF